MKISDLYPDVLMEDARCEFKAALNPENPVKWAKTIVAYANSDGGYIFVGVSNEREAFGLNMEEIDKSLQEGTSSRCRRYRRKSAAGTS